MELEYLSKKSFCGKISGENVEHSSKDGQYQQYTSGNDDEEFG